MSDCKMYEFLSPSAVHYPLRHRRWFLINAHL